MKNWVFSDKILFKYFCLWPIKSLRQFTCLCALESSFWITYCSFKLRSVITLSVSFLSDFRSTCLVCSSLQMARWSMRSFGAILGGEPCLRALAMLGCCSFAHSISSWNLGIPHSVLPSWWLGRHLHFLFNKVLQLESTWLKVFNSLLSLLKC